tara:strand:- start:206 stop:1450 length:1245 start_codon:yes stop_codon:yes gene_type:complete
MFKNKYFVTIALFSIILIIFVIYNNNIFSKIIIEPHSNFSSTPTLLVDDTYYTSTPGLWDKYKTQPLIGGQKFYNVSINIKDESALNDSVENPESNINTITSTTVTTNNSNEETNGSSNLNINSGNSNWEIYNSGKKYNYNNGDPGIYKTSDEQSYNTNYKCREKCNTNSDGTENTSCKAYLFNDSYDCSGNISFEKNTTKYRINNYITDTAIDNIDNIERCKSKCIEIGNDCKGYTFKNRDCKIISNLSKDDSGEEIYKKINKCCKLITDSVSQMIHNSIEHATGGLIYNKTSNYQHIKAASPEDSITNTIDFGTYGSNIKCKKDGETLCGPGNGETTCVDFQLPANATCETQPGQGTTTSDQFDLMNYRTCKDSTGKKLCQGQGCKNYNLPTGYNCNVDQNNGPLPYYKLTQ